MVGVPVGDGDAGIQDRPLLRVDPCRRDPHRQTISVDAALPATLGEIVVMIGTDQRQVADIGVTAVVPGDHMMPFTPLG